MTKLYATRKKNIVIFCILGLYHYFFVSHCLRLLLNVYYIYEHTLPWLKPATNLIQFFCIYEWWLKRLPLVSGRERNTNIFHLNSSLDVPLPLTLSILFILDGCITIRFFCCRFYCVERESQHDKPSEESSNSSSGSIFFNK